MLHGAATEPCQVRRATPPSRRERGLRAVVALTAVMMVIEIAAGWWTKSMALTADGFHMATHVGALGMAAAAYALARRFAEHRAFTFGTGKLQSLAGYTSAVLLAVVALSMAYESVERIFAPRQIDFEHSLPVAVIGLFVNLWSIRLLHGREVHGEPQQAGDQHGHTQHHDHEHEHHHPHHHDHEHDPNHRAAVVHVVADALTSGLAIVALLAGRWLGISWLDPATGVVGGIVILKWSYDLCLHASHELLDFDPRADLERAIREQLERHSPLRVADLHLWPIGGGRRACVITLFAPEPASVESYRACVLQVADLDHLTIEVRSAAVALPAAGRSEAATATGSS